MTISYYFLAIQAADSGARSRSSAAASPPCVHLRSLNFPLRLASECGDLGRTMVSHTVGLDGVGKALEMLSNYQEMEPEFDHSDHAIKILVEP